MQSEKKWHVCSGCGKNLSSYRSLWRHKKNCRQASDNVHTGSMLRKRSPVISRSTNIATSTQKPPTFVTVASVKDVSSCENRPKNPKILALLYEIVNDDPKKHVLPHKIHQGFSIVPLTTPSLPSPLRKVSTPPSTPSPLPKKMLFSPPPKQQMLPKPSAEVITAVISSMSNILPTTTSSPRTKRDIVGHSDDEEDSSGGDESSPDESMSSKSDSSDDNMEVVEEFILPDTIEGIRDRFNELYVGFVRTGKHESRPELEFLLDELLRQGAIDPNEYTQLNTGLTVKEDLTTYKKEKQETGEDKEEDNLTNYAIQYLIRHDKEELQNLLGEIKIDEEFKDIVLDIEKLLETFFEEEFVDGEIVRSKINVLLKQLESSKIPKSKQHRIKMLLDDH